MRSPNKQGRVGLRTIQVRKQSVPCPKLRREKVKKRFLKRYGIFLKELSVRFTNLVIVDSQ